MSRASSLSDAAVQPIQRADLPVSRALLSDAGAPAIEGRDVPAPRALDLLDAATRALQARDIPVPPPLFITDGGTRTLQNIETPTPPPRVLPDNGIHNDDKRGLPAPLPSSTTSKERFDSEAPFIPPPPVIENGGIRTMSPIGSPVGREVEQRDVPADPYLPLQSEDGIAPSDDGPAPSEEGNFVPPPLVIPVNGAGERDQNQPALPTQTAYVPPPPTFDTGGEHTMDPEPWGRLIGKRQGPVPTGIPHPTFTTIYASPGGPPIPITEQRQLVTTYTPTTSCPPAPSSTDSEVLLDSTKPSACTTSLRSIITAICATTLTPLAAPPIAITDCSQYVTYSSQYGYTVLPEVTPTASVEGLPRYVQPVQTLTTYQAALWSDMVPGATPTAGIEVVCGAGSECRTETISPTITPTPSTAATGGEDLQGSEGQTQTASPEAAATPTPSAAATNGEQLQPSDGPARLLRRLFRFLT